MYSLQIAMTHYYSPSTSLVNNRLKSSALKLKIELTLISRFASHRTQENMLRACTLGAVSSAETCDSYPFVGPWQEQFELTANLMINSPETAFAAENFG